MGALVYVTVRVSGGGLGGMGMREVVMEPTYVCDGEAQRWRLR